MKPLLSALTLLLLLPATAAIAGEITAEQCEATRQAVLDELREGRIRSVALLEPVLAAAETDAERKMLQAEIEHVYDYEENQRSYADQLWGDCMRAVKG